MRITIRQTEKWLRGYIVSRPALHNIKGSSSDKSIILMLLLNYFNVYKSNWISKAKLIVMYYMFIACIKWICMTIIA